MSDLAVGEQVIALWGKKKKEYTVTIAKINDDGKTVKILWGEKTSEGNLLVSSKFPISNIKKEDDDEVPGVPGLFDDPDNPVDPDNADY